MSQIEPKSRIIHKHEQCHRLCRPGLFVQQPRDLRANALSLILRFDIKLLLKEFVTYESNLNPADFLTIKDNAPGIPWTLQAGKLSLLVCIDPLDPGTCKRSDRFGVEIKSKGIDVRIHRSGGNCHWRSETIEGGDPTGAAYQDRLRASRQSPWHITKTDWIEGSIIANVSPFGHQSVLRFPSRQRLWC